MPRHLTPEQIEALRSVPLGEMPNRLRVALAMVKAKQADVAEETGIVASSISDIFNGKYVDLHWETVRKLSNYFGCDDPTVLFPSRAA